MTPRISIHALCEEGDRAQWAQSPCRHHFYPRPLRGGRHRHTPTGTGSPEFLSTPSARRATRFHPEPCHRQRISIHALCEEGDIVRAGIAPCCQISIHALCEEGDAVAQDAVEASVEFLSTPSARRATPQPRSPGSISSISIHALCEEGDYGPGHQRPDQSISIHALCEEGDPAACFLLSCRR